MNMSRFLSGASLILFASTLGGCSGGGSSTEGGGAPAGPPVSSIVGVAQLISLNLAGSPGNNHSGNVASHTVSPSAGGATFSPLGRQVAISQTSGLVAFTSSANDLLLGDTNAVDDVFVRNRANASTTRVSVATSGIQADKASFSPVMSADGRYVAFSSLATNLDPLLTSPDPSFVSSSPVNIFRRDRVTGITELVNVALGGPGGARSASRLGQNQLESKVPSMSDDGRFVAWIGDAAAFPSGVGIYVRDMSITAPPAGYIGPSEYRFGASTISGSGPDAVTGIEQSSPFASPPQGVTVVALSGNGQVLAFLSDRAHIPRIANPIPTGDLNCAVDLYVGDVNLTAVQDPKTPFVMIPPPQILNVTRVTAMPDACPSGSNSFMPRLALSRDGRFVAYATTADQLSGLDTNGKSDVYVYDRTTQTKELVSVVNGTPAIGAIGTLGNGDSGGNFSITDDGNLIAFLSTASNLVANDANGATYDVFVRNRATKQTVLVSKSQSGAQPNTANPTRAPVISGDGSGVAFSSDANTLLPPDSGSFYDVFLACTGLAGSCP